jgi:hypothetical protein
MSKSVNVKNLREQFSKICEEWSVLSVAVGIISPVAGAMLSLVTWTLTRT